MLPLRALLFIAVSLTPAAAWAGSDSQIWGTASANIKLSDKWRLSQEVVTRFSDNRDGLYEIEMVTLLGYRLGKNLTLAAGYVHSPQYSSGDHTTTERRAREQITIDNFAKLGTGTLSGRMRLEQRWRDNADGTGWRLRPYLKYSLPLMGKTAVNLTTEPFINLNNTSFQTADGLERVRNLISISSPISKRVNGEFGYMNQHGFVHGGEDTSDNIGYFALSANF